jgi:hypothetical protein
VAVLCSGYQANDLVCSSSSVIEQWLRGVLAINPMTMCVHLVVLLCTVFLSFSCSFLMLIHFHLSNNKKYGWSCDELVNVVVL